MIENTAKFIVQLISKELNIQLSFAQFANKAHSSILATDNKNKQYVIVCNSLSCGKVMVKSVLRITRPSSKFTYLINGQAAVNTKEIVFYGETYKIELDADTYIQEMVALYSKENFLDLIDKNIFKVPSHITQEQFQTSLNLV